MHGQTSQSSGSCSCLNDVIHDINVERDRGHRNPGTRKGRHGFRMLGSICSEYSNRTVLVAALTASADTESAKVLEIGNWCVLMLNSLVGRNVT
jgi:hypothetical protein